MADAGAVEEEALRRHSPRSVSSRDSGGEVSVDRGLLSREESKHLCEALEELSDEESEPLMCCMSRKHVDSSSDNYASELRSRIQNYGAMIGSAPPPDKFGWFERGFILNLVKELCTFYGAYVSMVFIMVMAPFFGNVEIDRYFPCQMKKRYVQTQLGAIVCEYTKTYAWSFPQMVLASLLLLMGRDLVQKRFYYFMLRNGGVLSFMKRSMLRDNIVILNVFIYLHFVAFCGLIALRLTIEGIDPRKAAWTIGRATLEAASNPSGAASTRQKLVSEPDDPEGLTLLVHLVVFLGLPGALWLVKLFGSYDIEKTLVPLSEYVRDVTTGTVQEKPDWHKNMDSEEHFMLHSSLSRKSVSQVFRGEQLASTDLANLVSMKDNILRKLLKVHYMMRTFHNYKHDPEKGERNRYEEVLDLYVREGWCKLLKEPHHTKLVSGLWPAPFISSEAGDANQYEAHQPGDHLGQWSFKLVWSIYRQVVLWTCGVILLAHAGAIIIDGWRAYNEHWEAAFGMIGELVNMYFVQLIWEKFYRAAPLEVAFKDVRLSPVLQSDHVPVEVKRQLTPDSADLDGVTSAHAATDASQGRRTMLGAHTRTIS